MSNDDLVEAIREVDCFQGIHEEDLGQIAKMGRVIEFAANEIVFREGDTALSSYVVVSGTLSLEVCAPGIGCRRLSTIRDGEFLGWSPVLDNFHMTVTARTVTICHLIELPKDQLLALCERSPHFGYVFMRGVAQTLARRLSAARMQLLNLFGDEAETNAADG
ncbi:hypothetical protein C5Y96_22705 [Blastopirellula marina]|uniref:Cyclic nucleotide-binding domain-containing protein n=1 Tax=Blastopirellula marina TaxID=124 RepID=A0A2S8F0D7_9BACT|nr:MULTISPECIES: Crp/Fnr family transcriptional regulator [Pirellulaceae]PQO25635.1 hypothetical protein C5Y96_22705 [Blastopirellula marina]RCS43318.1 Crp/Fnr family transcriptional regulator [Bremerella cremea]